MQCKHIMILVVCVALTTITTSCNRRSAIMIKKALHDYEHAAEHHEGQNNGGDYQEQDSYNSSVNKEGRFSVDGIAVDNNGYMSPLKSKNNWAIVTQDNLFLEHNMIRMKAYMNNESTIKVHINVFEIPVNDEDYSEFKTVDVSIYKFVSQDDSQTYFFNVYNR